MIVTQEQETQTQHHVETKQYHPDAEKLKVRKTRHRRTHSQGSYNSPRLSPMRERRISSQSCASRRISQGSFADHESHEDSHEMGAAFLFFQKQHSTSSNNGNLTLTSPEEGRVRRRSSCSSSSSSSSEEECQIVDDDPDNDILETLDRKVSEVINRSRFNSSPNILGGNMNSETYGPLSFSYNRRSSPNTNRRLSPATLASGLVRFDDDDEDKLGGVLTDDSSADDQDHNDKVNKWSDDETIEQKPDILQAGLNNNPFPIKRKRFVIPEKFDFRQKNLDCHFVFAASQGNRSD